MLKQTHTASVFAVLQLSPGRLSFCREQRRLKISVANALHPRPFHSCPSPGRGRLQGIRGLGISYTFLGMKSMRPKAGNSKEMLSAQEWITHSVSCLYVYSLLFTHHTKVLSPGQTVFSKFSIKFSHIMMGETPKNMKKLYTHV